MLNNGNIVSTYENDLLWNTKFPKETYIVISRKKGILTRDCTLRGPNL